MTDAKRIYYLDDDPELLDVFRDYMAHFYTNVAVFESADTALTACREAPPAVMVIDYRLSDTTGDEVVTQLSSEIKTILVSGELDLKPKQRFDHFMAKPFQLRELKQLIDTLLGD